MSVSKIRAGQAFVELLLENSKFVAGLRQASKKLKNFGSGAMALGAQFTAIGASITAPILGAVKHFASLGDALDKTSLRTGVSASSLAELKFAAEQSGTSLEMVEKGLFGLSRSFFDMQRGSKLAKDSFGELGLTLADLAGKSPEEQLQLVADGLANIEDASKRGAVAQQLLGRAGRQLLPMVENMRGLRQQARDLNLVPSEESVKSAAEVTDAMNVVSRTIGATLFEIGAAVADTVLEALDYVTGIAVATTEWVRENKELFVTILKVGAAVTAAGAVITGIGIAISGAGIALGGIATGVSLLGTVLATILSPIGLITAAVVGGIYAWTQYTESGKAALSGVMQVLGDLYSTVTDTFGGIFDAIAGGNLALAGTIAMTGLQLAFMQGMSAIASAFGGSFGDLIGTLSALISGGDFAGAWEVAVSGMAVVWDGFVEGIVAVFTQAARAITDLWEGTVNKITDQLLAMSAEGGVFGKVANVIVGADLSEIQKERDRLNKALGVSDNGNVLENAQQAARAQTGGTGDFIRSNIDEFQGGFQRQTDASADALRKRTTGGTSAASDEVSSLQAELERLLQEAADLRAAQAEKRRLASEEVGGLPTEDELSQGQSKVIGSFSAAALAVQGAGSSPMDKVAQEVKDVGSKIDELIALDERVLTEIRAGGQLNA